MKWCSTIRTPWNSLNRQRSYRLNIYGTIPVLPGQSVNSDEEKSSDPSRFASRLLQTMKRIKKELQRERRRQVQLGKHLQICKFVFVRVDTVKKPLIQPYEGPCRVVKRTAKHFIIKKTKGR